MNAFTCSGGAQPEVNYDLHTHEIRRRIEFLDRHRMLSCREALLRLQAAGFSAHEALRTVRAQRALFYVQFIDVAYFPAFQWRHIKLRAGMSAVLEAFGTERTKWHIALWLVSAHELLDGHRPIDLLDSEPRWVANIAALDAFGRKAAH